MYITAYDARDRAINLDYLQSSLILFIPSEFM